MPCELCGKDDCITTAFGNGPSMCSECMMRNTKRFEVGHTYKNCFDRRYRCTKRTRSFVAFEKLAYDGRVRDVIKAKILGEDGSIWLSEYVSSQHINVRASDEITDLYRS